MRLVNTKTLELKEFPDERSVRYAILSHRWQEEEVTFRDMNKDLAKSRIGYTKLRKACQKAYEDGFLYLWSDTCCINKDSSAELSEAINSMYRWYNTSRKCYAYLYDVSESEVSAGESFKKSVWFTRGWTLQELLAPDIVEFYNRSWQKIGTKYSLSKHIASVTRIDEALLNGKERLEKYTVAQRMCWAAERETTRVEDIAYSLMGIFGVNMPMLYGEGEKAFFRLQEEIIKYNDDPTIYAWEMSEDEYRGLLAKSPAEFAGCASVVRTEDEWQEQPISLSSRGFEMELYMLRWSLDTYIVALDVERSTSVGSFKGFGRIGIFLSLLRRHDRYSRIRVNGQSYALFPGHKQRKSIHRKKAYIVDAIGKTTLPMDRLYGFYVRTPPPLMDSIQSDAAYTSFIASHPFLNKDTKTFRIPDGSETTICHFDVYCSIFPHLKIYFDDDFNPYISTSTTLIEATDALIANKRGFDINPLDRKFTYQGARGSGVRREVGGYTISLQKEVVSGCTMWVLDIGITQERSQFNHRKRTDFKKNCGWCHDDIYGVLFRCVSCKAIVCGSCIPQLEDKHGSQGHQPCFKTQVKRCPRSCSLCDRNSEIIEKQLKSRDFPRERLETLNFKPLEGHQFH